MTLTNTHAVVTGGASGIGAAISTALLRSGAKVSIMGRRHDVLLDAVAQFPNSKDAQAIVCDVSNADSVTQAFNDASSTFGAINVLVNCAGAAPTMPFHKLNVDDWNDVLAVNLNGVFHCTSAVINEMREKKSGRIINIASTSALKGYAYVSAYCAAKHGVLGLTRALALETAAHGITVNAICPGYTDTDIIRDSVKNIVEKTGRSETQALETFTNTNPQKRLIDPEEVADTVLWLCSNGSRSITGQAISVSGGEVM
ncbi:MAG: SDR family NAD(P)-dependent oxidoreductase [Pseudomonadales bacterium]